MDRTVDFFLYGGHPDLEQQVSSMRDQEKPLPTEIVFQARHAPAFHVPFQEMCGSKYQLHIAGHSCAASLKYKLACGSLVFVARNPYVEFWYSALNSSAGNPQSIIWLEPDGNDFIRKLFMRCKTTKNLRGLRKTALPSPKQYCLTML